MRTGQGELANRRIQPLCHLSAANVLQHCNLLLHLVTVPPSVAAFWCTAVNPILRQNAKVTLLSYPATSCPYSTQSKTLDSLEKGRFSAMNKGKVWRHPETFHRMAIERFKCCENIKHLAKELGVARQTFIPVAQEERVR
jgi:hypothetical protein